MAKAMAKNTKKFISIVFASAFILILTGCGSRDSGGERSEEMKNKWGITLEARNVTPTGMTLAYSQSGGENVPELTTGERYIVQKHKLTGWKEVKNTDNAAWILVAYVLPKEATHEFDINWENLYGRLPDGEYRIGKEISDEMFYACFTINKKENNNE